MQLREYVSAGRTPDVATPTLHCGKVISTPSSAHTAGEAMQQDFDHSGAPFLSRGSCRPGVASRTSHSCGGPRRSKGRGNTFEAALAALSQTHRSSILGVKMSSAPLPETRRPCSTWRQLNALARFLFLGSDADFIAIRGGSICLDQSWRVQASRLPPRQTRQAFDPGIRPIR